MVTHQDLVVRGDMDEMTLTTTYQTDDYERLNYERKKEAGKGFIRNARGKISGRCILSIPVEDAMLLRVNYDIDWLLYEETQDVNALRRLVKRFPYWRVAEGGI